MTNGDLRHDSKFLLRCCRMAGTLANRFETLSTRFPLLRLVAVRVPESLSRVPILQDGNEIYEDLGNCYPDVRGRFTHQSLDQDDFQDEESHQSGNLTLYLHLPCFSFPMWHFPDSSPAAKNGFWEIWLHRDYGRDPKSKSMEILDPADQLACLESYNQVLNDAAEFGKQVSPILKWQEWPFLETTSWAPGFLFMDGFDVNGKMVWWLLLLLCMQRHRVVQSNINHLLNPDEKFYGNSERFDPHELWIVDEIGGLSAEFLAHTQSRLEELLKEVEKSPDVMNPVTPSTSAENERWLPSVLDPTPNEVKALVERSQRLAKLCEQYDQRLAGQPVKDIFDTPEMLTTLLRFADSLNSLANWNVGHEPLVCDPNPIDEIAGWPPDCFASYPCDIHRCVKTIYDRLETVIPFARQIRWICGGSEPRLIVWYEKDQLEAVASRFRRDVTAHTRFSSSLIVDSYANGLQSKRQKGSEIPQEMSDVLCSYDIPPENGMRLLAISTHRKQLAMKGEWVYETHGEEENHITIEVSDDLMFPALPLATDIVGDELENTFSTVSEILYSSGEIIEILSLDDKGIRLVDDGFGVRHLVMDLTRLPGYRGYSVPANPKKPYPEKLLERDVFNRALHLEASEGIRLVDGSDPVELLEAFEEYKAGHERGDIRCDFKTYAVHRYGNFIRAIGLADSSSNQAIGTESPKHGIQVDAIAGESMLSGERNQAEVSNVNSHPNGDKNRSTDIDGDDEKNAKKTPTQLKVERDDELLSYFLECQEPRPTYPDLLDWLDARRVEREWPLLESSSSVGDALRRAWKRKNPETPWPIDGRGKNNKRK